MEILEVGLDYLKSDKNIENYIKQFFPNCNLNIYKKLDNKFYVIFNNNEIYGFFNIFKNNRIQRFAILPQFRNQKIGTNAISLITQKYPNLHCFIKRDNPAIQFWLKNNFIIKEEIGNIIKLDYLSPN